MTSPIKLSGTVQTSAEASPLLLFALAIAQLSLSYCFVAFFSSYFGFGRRFPFSHLSEIAAVIVLIGLIAGSLMHAGFLRGRSGRRLFAASLGAGSALLSLLYLGDFATNRLWNGNINYEIVRDYSLWALKPHSESLQVSPAVYAVALVIAIGMPTLFVALSDRLFAGLESLIFSNRPYYPFANRRRAPYVLGGLATVVGALGIVLLSLTRFMSGAGLLHRDPVVGFFRRQGAVGQFGWYLNFEDQRRSVTEERAAYRERKQTATRNVVVIIVDSLRADHMPLYGYARPTTPFLSKLETDGHLRKVRVATSMCAQSPCGILSTMSGKNVPTIEYDFKIFDLLHDIGYRSYFILGGHHSWEGLRQAYGDEQAIYFDGSYSKLGFWDDDRIIDEGLNLVPPNATDKAFFYIHLMSAHLSGARWPEYQRYVPSDLKMELSTLLTGTYDRAKSVNRYDNGVLQADGVIEKVFVKLQSLGYLKNSIVVILADHGEELGERGAASFGHGGSLHSEAIHIPLLIYDDQDVEYRNLDFTSQIDVAPTIADRLGLDIPKSWTGRSMLQPTSDRTVVMGRPGCGAVLQASGGGILHFLKCGGSEELFELNSDPTEKHNIIESAEATAVSALREKLNGQ